MTGMIAPTRAARGGTSHPEPPFASSLQHVLVEIRRLELVVRVQLERSRHAPGESGDLKGLVISDAEIADLLRRPHAAGPFPTAQSAGEADELRDAIEAMSKTIARRRDAALVQGKELRLVALEEIFALSALDIAILVVCLAIDLDTRFERFYAYLQDDVTRKYASIDLALNLTCSTVEEKIAGRQRFAPGAPLIRHRLVRILEDSSRTAEPMASKALRLDERISRFVLGSDEPDASIADFARCIEPHTTGAYCDVDAELQSRLTALMDVQLSPEETLFYFYGPYGSGLQGMAETLSGHRGRSLVSVDIEALLAAHGNAAPATLAAAVREAALRRGSLYLDKFDVLLPDDKAVMRRAVLRELIGWRGLLMASGETAWHPQNDLAESGLTFEWIAVEFNRPDFAARCERWAHELGSETARGIDHADLANKFRLTGGQIRDAARTARELARWRAPSNPTVAMSDVLEACRIQSSRRLCALGHRLKPHYRWEDLVLPEDRLRSLREICNWVKYRSVVFDQWGFDRKLSLGKGLNMLFAGPPGTGKTMAAEIMAGEVGWDAYKIDLSTVVSKYIGETEKNLARIFSEAEAGNAILFFDEADALFGKRTEVHDSHDRYANIEINYLLQKMEEHEGVVILATNFRKNMDDAFVRRLHFTIDFPVPSEADRRRIWEGIWPAETPKAVDLDFDFMARRFELPGGNIRNIAMAAAFLAASNGGIVTMNHLLHGTRREYQKMGKIASEGEFQ